MSVEPTPYFDDGADPSMVEAERILALVDARLLAETRRLDREDELDREAQARVDADNAEMAREVEAVELLDALEAADLARSGFDPNWDWRSVLDQHGFDEFGNPTRRESQPWEGTPAASDPLQVALSA